MPKTRILPQPLLFDLTDEGQAPRSKTTKRNEVPVPRLTIDTVRHRFSDEAEPSGTDENKAPIFGSHTNTGVTMPFGLPFIRIKRGQKPKVDVLNRTSFAFNLHWHGLNTTADVDGASTQVMFGPDTNLGKVLQLRFPTVHNNSALLWLHAHPMFTEQPLVYAGLYGLVQVLDDESAKLDQLFRYGDNHLLLAYQDADFDAQGRLTPANLNVDEERACFGVVNGVACVNWTVSPDAQKLIEQLHHTTTQKLVRVDVLNAASSFRNLYIGVTDFEGKELRDFYAIQSDTGLQNPSKLRVLAIPPAGRVGILIDLSQCGGGGAVGETKQVGGSNEEEGRQAHKPLGARVVLLNMDLTEVSNMEFVQRQKRKEESAPPVSASTSTSTSVRKGILVADVPDLKKTREPTPTPTPIPSTDPDGSRLTFPPVSAVPTVKQRLQNGNQRLPDLDDPRLVSFKTLVCIRHRTGDDGAKHKESNERDNHAGTRLQSVSLSRALSIVRQIVFGPVNYRQHKKLLKTPNFELLPGVDYLSFLNPNYFYNLPVLRADGATSYHDGGDDDSASSSSNSRSDLARSHKGPAVRNLMLFGDTIQNTNVPGGNPLGSTEAINNAQRVAFDLWSDHELSLEEALAKYAERPNDYRPDVLPTLLFQIFPSSPATGAETEQHEHAHAAHASDGRSTTTMTQQMIANDTLIVDFFPASEPLVYGDTKAKPKHSITIRFPATEPTKPLNIRKWTALVNQMLAKHKLQHVLSLDWTFYPFQLSYVDPNLPPRTLKSVMFKVRNQSHRYRVRLRAPWTLLQFFGKPITADHVMHMSPPPTIPKDHVAVPDQTTGEEPHVHVDDQHVSTPPASSPSTSLPVEVTHDHEEGGMGGIQTMFPQYATRDPDQPIFLMDSHALAEMIIDPEFTYLGPIDGFMNAALSSVAVQLGTTEQWVYHNLDNQDSHPFHFHLTSGFVPVRSPLSSKGLVSARRDYAPLLYSRETYGIGAQQSLAFYLRFINYQSKDSARKPGIKGLSFPFHCHYGAHSSAMVNQYYVYAERGVLLSQ